MVDATLNPLFARLTTPRAMVVRMPAGNTLGPSTVKVLAVNPHDLQSIVYKEAWVGNQEDVQVGEQRTILIRDVGEITQEDNSHHITMKKDNGDVLIQLQLESEDEAQLWLHGITILRELAGQTSIEPEAVQSERDENFAALLSLRQDINEMQQRLLLAQQEPSGEPEDENGDKEPHEEPPLRQNSGSEEHADASPDTVQSKQARQIDNLMHINDQKEQTIQRLTHRLEHSLEMLKAVHEMYDQQKSVLLQQQRVIEEFRAERAERRGAQPKVADTRHPVAAVPKLNGKRLGSGPPSKTPVRQQLDRLRDQPDAIRFQDLVDIEQKIGSNGEPALESMDDLLSLLQQVEVLKSSIEGLEQTADADADADADATDESDGESSPGPPALTKPDDQDELSNLGENLRLLEVEKHTIQSQLRDAQSEQEEMVRRLGEMKSMMDALNRLQPQKN